MCAPAVSSSCRRESGRGWSQRETSAVPGTPWPLHQRRWRGHPEAARPLSSREPQWLRREEKTEGASEEGCGGRGDRVNGGVAKVELTALLGYKFPAEVAHSLLLPPLAFPLPPPLFLCRPACLLPLPKARLHSTAAVGATGHDQLSHAYKRA